MCKGVNFPAFARFLAFEVIHGNPCDLCKSDEEIYMEGGGGGVGDVRHALC